MTYDQYWYGDACIAQDYLEAFRLKQKQINERMWLQGLYIYDGLCCALGAAFGKKGTNRPKYPDAPYEIHNHSKPQEAPDPEHERLKAELFFRKWADAVGKNFQN